MSSFYFYIFILPSFYHNVDDIGWSTMYITYCRKTNTKHILFTLKCLYV